LFNLDLIRLVVPQVAPGDLAAAIKTALVVGAIAGAFTALTGAAIYRARGWTASPWVRVVLCGAALAATALAIASIARPTAAVGPGGGAVVWAEGPHVTVSALLAVALLRAIATTAAVGAGGCGGVFVPFLAIGDIAGRAFAPGLGVSSDLAGAAGAAGGIAGGYRLPLTAVAMVIGIGGPSGATWTCLATVGVAALAGIGAGSALDSVTRRRLAPHID
jgi:H+/Cl- antiporter ClcA